MNVETSFQDLLAMGIQELGLPGVGTLALLVFLVGVIASGVTNQVKKILGATGVKMSNKTYDAVMSTVPVLLSVVIMGIVFQSLGFGFGWGVLWGFLAGVLSSSTYAKVRKFLASDEPKEDA